MNDLPYSIAPLVRWWYEDGPDGKDVGDPVSRHATLEAARKAALAYARTLATPKTVKCRYEVESVNILHDVGEISEVIATVEYMAGGWTYSEL